MRRDTMCVAREWKSPLVCTRSRQSSDSSKQSSSAAGEEGGNKKKGLFYSKGVLYTLLLTNLVSLLIGAGFGYVHDAFRSDCALACTMCVYNVRSYSDGKV